MELPELQARNAQILALLQSGQHPLPSPSSVALELMRQVERHEVGIFDICRTARNDPTLVARTVQVANSALYAGLRQTAAIEDAVMRIGVSALARLAVGLTLVHAAGNWIADFDLTLHWRCALARGLVTQQLAGRLRNLPSSEAFTLGLLSDIGQLAMLAAFGQDALRVPADAALNLLEHQRQRWGFDQNQASAALLESWGFPVSLWLAVLPIGQDTAHAAGRDGDLVLMVDVARSLSACLCGPSNPSDLPGLHLGTARLGVDQETMVSMLDRIRTDLPSIARILDLDMPAQQADAEFQRLRTALTVTPPLDDHHPDSALLIGKDRQRCEALRQMLEDGGTRVLLASDLEQGIDALRLHQPQVLVLDGDLPGVDMPELCRQLRREFGYRLYMLLLTSQLDSEWTLRAIDAGVNDVLAKGVEHKLLSAKVKLGGRTVRVLSALENERLNAFSMQRELARMNANLRSAAYTDDLTGLANRRALDEFLESAWSEAVQSRQPLSCVMLDLDHFKMVNDRYGHDVGDRVLRAVTRVMREQTRAADLLARWGGEELVLVCTHTDAKAAAALAERMRLAVERMQGDFPTVTLSAGVAQAHLGREQIADLLRNADHALLQAKRAGRNCVVVAVEEGLGQQDTPAQD